MDDLSSETEPPSTESPNFIIYIVIAAIFGILVIGLASVTYWCWRLKPKKSDVEAGHHPMPSPAEYSLEKLKLLSVIGKLNNFLSM